jgi:hypothetical protein
MSAGRNTSGDFARLLSLLFLQFLLWENTVSAVYELNYFVSSSSYYYYYLDQQLFLRFLLLCLVSCI